MLEWGWAVFWIAILGITFLMLELPSAEGGPRTNRK
jgi:hypothetical protein